MEPIAIAVLVFVFVSLVETGLAVAWNHSYFLMGIPIYKHRVDVQKTQPRLPPADSFETRFGSNWEVSLVFRQFQPDVYFFREELLPVFKPLGYTRIMHGVLHYDMNASRLTVTGYANWSFLALVVLIPIALGVTNWLAVLPMFAILCLITAVIYVVQSGRYTEVAKFAAYRWSVPGPGQINGA